MQACWIKPQGADLMHTADSRLLPQPEKWLYAQIPNFEILSSISARQTKRFVQDFLLLQEVIEKASGALQGKARQMLDDIS